MKLPIYQVDAFTSKIFGGCPAAVIPLSEWLPDDILHLIAKENNIAGTVFYVPEKNRFKIRWFTTQTELPLCGHSTLATAFIIYKRGYDKEVIEFDSQSGALQVKRDSDYLCMDFPALHEEEINTIPTDLIDAINYQPQSVHGCNGYLVELENEAQIRNLTVDIDKIKKLSGMWVIFTAPGKTVDFVSRVFSPNFSSEPECQVTGSAHSLLAPFWSKRFGKTKFEARQLSQRVGDLWCECKNDRVIIKGKAVLYMEGEIFI